MPWALQTARLLPKRAIPVLIPRRRRAAGQYRRRLAQRQWRAEDLRKNKGRACSAAAIEEAIEPGNRAAAISAVDQRLGVDAARVVAIAFGGSGAVGRVHRCIDRLDCERCVGAALFVLAQDCDALGLRPPKGRGTIGRRLSRQRIELGLRSALRGGEFRFRPAGRRGSLRLGRSR